METADAPVQDFYSERLVELSKLFRDSSVLKSSKDYCPLMLSAKDAGPKLWFCVCS
jgi:hypothetical protein